MGCIGGSNWEMSVHATSIYQIPNSVVLCVRARAFQMGRKGFAEILKMKRTVTILFFFLPVFLFAFPSFHAEAIEVYTFINQDCRTETGLIVALDKSQVSILNTEGKLTFLPRKEVNYILIYKLDDNPLSGIEMDRRLIDLAKKIYVEKLDKPLFLGWPTRFIDDLVVFYDLNGKDYTIEINKIYNIESLDETETGLKKLEKYKAREFSFGRNFPECGIAAKTSDNTVQPMRSLSDRIKVAKFFDTYENGFLRIQRFREKTVYYAEPVYYDDKSSIGFVYTPRESLTFFDGPQEMPAGIPLFFRWSGGRPYSYQHQSVIGANPSSLTPQVEPVFQFGSDIKAHLFHGSFALNIMGFYPGFPILIPNMAGAGGFADALMEKGTMVITSFNYVALSGVDYGRYSVSGGMSYPVFGIQTGGREGLFRELLPYKGSPTFRFRYFGDDFLFRGMVWQTRYGSDDPTISEIVLFETNQLKDWEQSFEDESWYELTEAVLDSYRFEARFFRLGFDWDINQEVEFGIDQLVLNGDYQETIGDLSQENPTLTKNRVEFTNHAVSLHVRHEFGQQIALTGYFNYYLRDGKSNFFGDEDTTKESKYSLTMLFEFLL